MKPSTILQIKDRLKENLENMEDCEEEGTYNEMEMENETMAWICKAEGQKREYNKAERKIEKDIQQKDQDNCQHGSIDPKDNMCNDCSKVFN